MSTEPTSGQFLEDELAAELVRAGLSHHQTEAVAMRLGWDGRGGTTLEEAGDHAGVTRERVRQLERRLADHLSATKPQLPVLARAVAELERIAPLRRDEASAGLSAAGVSRSDFDPYGVLETAEMVGITTSLHVTPRLLLRDNHAIVLPKLGETARKLVSHNGAGNVGALVDTIALDDIDEAIARRLLDTYDEIIWLDAEHDWFFLTTARNRAFNYLRKMLSVTPSLTLTEIRDGLRRHARSVNLPRSVIRAMSEQLEWVKVDGDVVTSTIELDFRDVLENTEETLVDLFTEHGPVLDRQTAVGLAETYGLDRTTAALYLGWSPVIERLAVNRYALRGADIPTGTLESMRGSDRRRRVQQGHGWTKSGRLWIAYTLSQAVIDTNVVGVPGALRDELRGRYRLQPEDEHLGELATDGQNLWGLARVLRRSGAEPGDALVLEFDLVASQCYAFVGGAELLDPENRVAETDPQQDPASDNGLETLLPPQSGLFSEQPTLHPEDGTGAGGHDNTADASSVARTAGHSLGGTAVLIEATTDEESANLVEDLLIQVADAADVDPTAMDEGAVNRVNDDQPEQCAVPGCKAAGKNKLGVRCRVWHEPSPVPGKKKTSALWAPDTDAFLCDEHALAGAHITLLFEPNTSGTIAVRVIAASVGEDRTRPIKRQGNQDHLPSE